MYILSAPDFQTTILTVLGLNVAVVSVKLTVYVYCVNIINGIRLQVTNLVNNFTGEPQSNNLTNSRDVIPFNMVRPLKYILLLGTLALITIPSAHASYGPLQCHTLNPCFVCTNTLNNTTTVTNINDSGYPYEKCKLAWPNQAVRAIGIAPFMIYWGYFQSDVRRYFQICR
jgi:hypothetical protein